jgi:hypothetical protein
VAQRALINSFQNFHGTASGPPTESQPRKFLILFTIRPSSYNARDQRAYSPLVHSFVWWSPLIDSNTFSSKAITRSSKQHPHPILRRGQGEVPKKTDVCSVAIRSDRSSHDGNTIGYAKHRSRARDAVIRVYDEAGNVIETHEHAGDFGEP